MKKEEFIQKIAGYVKKYAAVYEIKVCSPIIAQAILESVTGRPSKSIEEVAGEVIQGKYGNGEERRKKLCDMGYDPDAVQREVNRQLSQNEAPTEYYVVQENDTLSEIAKRFATTYLELVAWNGIADPNMIYVGQKIRIR